MIIVGERGEFLARLGESHRTAIQRLAVERHHSVGSVLFHEGSRADRVLAITNGLVKLSRFSSRGREIVLALRGQGELLGEMSTIEGSLRSATATTLSRTTVLSISSKEFRSYLLSHGDVAVIVLEIVAARLRENDDRRVDDADHDALGRVARALAGLADSFGKSTPGGTVVEQLMSQDELAGFVGASRESVSKALRQLRSAGLISVQRRGATVVDLDALRLVGS